MKTAQSIAIAALAATAALTPTVVAAPSADAALVTISVTFGNWRCSATGGGNVVAVQMGSQYGSVPKAAGNTIKIKAKTQAKNNLTGAVWCKKWNSIVARPVYNIHQGIWVEKAGQHFNV